jgi:uncharacterized membrane protein YtjA (UPF0391 family)
MIEIAVGALVIALIAGALGFSGVARAASTVAKLAFGIFLIIAVILLLLVWGGINLLA